jgi:type III pantothenate kinase
MMLLVDAGAGMLRHARLSAGVLSQVGSAPHRGIDPDEWDAALGALQPAPQRVLVANGSGGPFALRFAAWVEHRWGLVAEFPSAAAGLSVDRWLGLVGAGTRGAGPYAVVVAGPAFSIDLVDGAGRHRGGYRIPGERLMREALHAQTSGIAAAALLDGAAVDGAFGVNTAGAVQQGARLALAALVTRLCARLAVEAGAPRVLITGAGGRDIAALLEGACEVVPDLVLEGLARVALGDHGVAA